MNPQVKLRPDDTRARIMETADALFRRMGFAKTAVADIAAELGIALEGAGGRPRRAAVPRNPRL